MNEAGILRHILPSERGKSGQNGQRIGQKCKSCGGARFIPCTKCNGSTKSFVMRFPKSQHGIISLKCSQCSRGTGLIRCPLCFTNNRLTTATSSASNSNHLESLQGLQGLQHTPSVSSSPTA